MSDQLSLNLLPEPTSPDLFKSATQMWEESALRQRTLYELAEFSRRIGALKSVRNLSSDKRIKLGSQFEKRCLEATIGDSLKNIKDPAHAICLGYSFALQRIRDACVFRDSEWWAKEGIPDWALFEIGRLWAAVEPF